jgi:hypothetical protein
MGLVRTSHRKTPGGPFKPFLGLSGAEINRCLTPDEIDGPNFSGNSDQPDPTDA